jgi:RND family efflux transporter MFP subunit
MFRISPLLSALALSLALAGCGQGGPNAEKGAAAPKGDAKAAAAAPPLQISSEDVHTVKSAALASGPSVTGSIQPERRADLRAEVPAIVRSVLRENGDTVRRGDLLVHLDDTSIRDALASAEASARAADLALEQATRQFERMKTLRGSGMASAQALDDAEGRRNAAISDQEAAKARVVAARQQMQRTEVRAPFDGIVSERKVSAGDTAQVGKELLKVIDPNSMRFEALVSADHVGEVKAGQGVSFRVNGYADQEFKGKVRRVNPSANPTTRQVEMLIDFVGDKQPKLAGLYAEGRLETSSRAALTVPATAVVRDGDKSSAFRVQGDKLQKVLVTVSDRDARTGELVVTTGLAEGDRVIRYPTALLKDGQAIVASSPEKSSAVAVSFDK